VEGIDRAGDREEADHAAGVRVRANNLIARREIRGTTSFPPLLKLGKRVGHTEKRGPSRRLNVLRHAAAHRSTSVERAFTLRLGSGKLVGAASFPASSQQSLLVVEPHIFDVANGVDRLDD
jgi:hypothetical protein